MVKIGDVFDFISETNITEQVAYLNKGVYPVYSGQTKNNGLFTQINTYNEEKPCLSFTTYGSAGNLFYREGKFTIGRNCMGLTVKSKWKDKINLKWFYYTKKNLLLKNIKGDKGGQRSLNKIILERVEFNYPNVKQQQKIVVKYEKITNNIKVIDEKITNIQKLLGTIIKSNIKYKEIIGNIFNIEGGNSGLTEEFIYNNQPIDSNERILILSSSTNEKSSMGYMSSNAKIKGKALKIFNPLCILIARNGYAGHMSLIDETKITTNDHAYIMTLKNEWKDKIDLKWFINNYQNLFYNIVTSKSDNGTFNKEYAERQLIQIPDYDKSQKIIGNKLLILENKLKKLEKIKQELNKIIKVELI